MNAWFEALGRRFADAAEAGVDSRSLAPGRRSPINSSGSFATRARRPGKKPTLPTTPPLSGRRCSRIRPVISRSPSTGSCPPSMGGDVYALAPASGGSIAEGTRTFLFADLRDYTAFVERHGDRVAADLVAAYRKLIRQRVQESSGAEIKVEGDAMFVVFASARQAIACGAAILSDAAVRTQAQPDLPMRVGIGLHAGEPVAQDDDFIGSAVNVAARIGAAAGAGQLLISEVVRALVRTGAPFPMRDRGPVTLKGLSEPVRLYEVVWSDVSPTDSAALIEGSVIPFPQPARLEAPGSSLVGRDDELALLRSRVAALSPNPPPPGEGRVGATGGTVMIAGDAGIGKSRLLREALFGSAPALLYGACGLSEAPPPYEPFVAIVRSIIREPNGEAALQGMIPELLALAPETAASRPQAPERDRLSGARHAPVRQYARARPTVLVVEDMHWADEA